MDYFYTRIETHSSKHIVIKTFHLRKINIEQPAVTTRANEFFKCKKFNYSLCVVIIRLFSVRLYTHIKSKRMCTKYSINSAAQHPNILVYNSKYSTSNVLTVFLLGECVYVVSRMFTHKYKCKYTIHVRIAQSRVHSHMLKQTNSHWRTRANEHTPIHEHGVVVAK